MATESTQGSRGTLVEPARTAGPILAVRNLEVVYQDVVLVLRGVSLELPRGEIVAGWLEDTDEPGSWEARYETLLVDGDRAVATGETRYAGGRTFSNVFVLAFDEDGRCREFTEWYMEHPRSTSV